MPVSIPQAVSTVATFYFYSFYSDFDACFNTASGKYCCNFIFSSNEIAIKRWVSIPQAVSTVATAKIVVAQCFMTLVSIPQAVSTVATKERIL